MTAPAQTPNRLRRTKKLFISFSQRMCGTEPQRLMTELTFYVKFPHISTQSFHFPSISSLAHFTATSLFNSFTQYSFSPHFSFSSPPFTISLLYLYPPHNFSIINHFTWLLLLLSYSHSLKGLFPTLEIKSATQHFLKN